jgi:hypothetical protein
MHWAKIGFYFFVVQAATGAEIDFAIGFLHFVPG